jgi:Phage integrase family.
VFAQFELYQTTMRPSSKNSAQSGGCRLKAFLNWCLKNGYTQDRTFQDVSTHKHVYGDAFYLLPEERNSLIGAKYGLSFHAPLVRDMFLFQCYVGCRVGDLFTIKRDQIKDGWLEYVPSKNEKNGRHEIVRVPLHPVAIDILKRYEEYSPRLFPNISLAQYNTYIKMILDFAGIHRLVTIIDPLTREERQVQLCEVATSHTARKTFIANLYNQVKDQELVAAFTGHAPGSKAFSRYRTIGDELKREIIQNIQ